MKKLFITLLIAFLLTFSASADAFIKGASGVIASSRATSGCTSLGSALSISGQLFELDATCASSYSGSGQTWANIQTAPADSSGQTAYDFNLGSGSGSDAADPTFNGSAGSSSAYFSFDGGDKFSIKGSNTTAIKNLHKTTSGQPATIIIAFRPGDTTTGQDYFGSTSSGSGDGFELRQFSSTSYRLNQTTSGSNHTTSMSVTAYDTSHDYLLAVTFDYTGATASRAMNATSFTAATLSSAADTTDCTSDFQVGDAGSANNVVSGFRLYGFYVFNKVISNTDLSNIVTALNTRHGRTYALLDMRPNVRYAANDSAMLKKVAGQ